MATVTLDRISGTPKAEETEPKFEFWGALYGSLIDKYGIRWMFNWEPKK